MCMFFLIQLQMVKSLMLATHASAAAMRGGMFIAVSEQMGKVPTLQGAEEWPGNVGVVHRETAVGAVVVITPS